MFKFLRKLFKKRSCYYIHSNIHLPAPLNEGEEARLLQLLEEEKCMDSRNILIEHNLRLVVYIAKKFESAKVSIEDLISIGSMGLIKGVQTFKRDKNIKLATYASRCIENEILMFLRKISKMKNELSLDETLNTDADGNELVLSDIICSNDEEVIEEVMTEEKEEFLYDCVEALNEREKRIIVLRFGLYKTESMTQKEVADYLNISQSYISRLEKKIIDKLKYNLELKIK